jgi:hypothetical protein
VRWSVPAAPSGAVLGFALAGLDERALLGAGGRPALYALDDAGTWHPERAPLVAIHGLEGAPSTLQAVVDRYRGSMRLQPYVVAYADSGARTSTNGDELAGELAALAARLGPGRALTIVAHSMGGVVLRRALDRLASDGNSGGFARIRAICVDTPWHGYPGPADGFLIDVAQPFLPAGMVDMRARSGFFATLYKTQLPDTMALTLVFAEEGSDVLDYTEAPLDQIVPQLAAHFASDAPVEGEPRLMNFWHALLDSAQYDAFADELRDLADANRVDAAAVAAALARHYPRFPGDHVGVVHEQPGRKSFLDWLIAELPP